MQDEFYNLIRPIAFRLKLNQSLRLASFASIAGLVVCIIFSLSFLQILFTTITLPIFLGVLFFCLRAHDTRQIAILIDNSLSLKNRVLSAYEILQTDSEVSAICELQICDTIRCLRENQLGNVMPISRPKILTFAFSLLLGISFSFVLPNVHSGVRQENATSQSEVLESSLEGDLLAHGHIEKILNSSIDNTEKLRLLSKLKMKIEDANRKSDFTTNTEDWNRIANALEAVPSTSEIAKDIRTINFESVANQLKQLDYNSLEKIERDTLEDNFNRISQSSSSATRQPIKDVSVSLQKRSPKDFSTAFQKLSDLANEVKSRVDEMKNVEIAKSNIELAKRAVSHRSNDSKNNKLTPLEIFKTSQATMKLERNGFSKDSDSQPDSKDSPPLTKSGDQYGPIVEYQREMEKIINKQEIPPIYRMTVRNYFKALQKLASKKRERTNGE